MSAPFSFANILRTVDSGDIMLKVIHMSNTLPISLPLDPTAEFEAGMWGQLKTIGNDTVIGVSDGTAPYGVIDDVKTSAFTKQQTDEIIIIDPDAAAIGTVNGAPTLIIAVKEELEFPSIVSTSFSSNVTVGLNAVNGVIEVPIGTALNHDLNGDGTFDSLKIVVTYTYRIANKPGDDSTLGSGRVTLHYQRAIFATDQYDPLQAYPLNATLYVGLDGKLTTAQATTNHPGIAMVTGVPSATNGTVEFMFL